METAQAVVQRVRTAQTALGTLYWGLQDSLELQTRTLVQLFKSSLSWVQRVRQRKQHWVLCTVQIFLELQTGTLVQLLKSSLSWVQRVRTAKVAMGTLYRAVRWFPRTAEQCRNSRLWKQPKLWYRE